MCSLIIDIYDDNFLSLRRKNNSDTYHQKIFDLFNNKFKIFFYHDILFVSLNDILIQKIYLYDYLMVKMVHNIYG